MGKRASTWEENYPLRFTTKKQGELRLHKDYTSGILRVRYCKAGGSTWYTYLLTKEAAAVASCTQPFTFDDFLDKIIPAHGYQQWANFRTNQASYKDLTRRVGTHFAFLESMGLVQQLTPRGTKTHRYLGRQANSGMLELRHSALLAASRAKLEDQLPFDPDAVEDNRPRVLREIALRQGQSDFRKGLMAAYGPQCMITGCDVVEVVEAAHIVPHRGKSTNHLSNGLLLRADLHTLFDKGLLSVDSITFTVKISPILISTPYEEFSGKPLNIAISSPIKPSTRALDWHRQTLIYERSRKNGEG